MKKILVTGGAGFIGSNLIKKLHVENQIIVVDDLSMGKYSNIENLSNVIFYKKSVLDQGFMEKLLIEENFDYIFHLAAIASVADSVKRPLETNKTNFYSTLLLLESLRKMNNKNLKRLIFASSASVYGDEETLPKNENSIIKPLSPYAIDKYASENYVLVYQKLYNIPTSAVRFFNVYGPNQNPASPYSGVISILIDKFEKKLRGEEEVFALFGDGSQTRDFIYVEDVVKALELVAYSEESLGKVFNVGTSVETNLIELLNIISKLLNIELEINQLEKREGDIAQSVSDISKLEKLGFKCNFSIEEGLKKYLSELSLI